MNRSSNVFKAFFAVIFAGCIMVFFVSCDVQKRHYRSGFYVGGTNDVASINRMEKNNGNLVYDLSGRNKIQDIAKIKISDKPLQIQKVISVSHHKMHHPENNLKVHKQPAENHPPVAEKQEQLNFSPKAIQEIDFSEERKIKNLYMAAFICGIASILLIFPSIAAVICGAIAISKAKKFPYRIENAGLGKAGFIIGIVYVSLIIIEIAALIILLAL